MIITFTEEMIIWTIRHCQNDNRIVQRTPFVWIPG